jgi:hypothetical protein
LYNILGYTLEGGLLVFRPMIPDRHPWGGGGAECQVTADR